MKQLLQSLRNGDTLITEVPAPSISPQQVLIRSHITVISAGTEKMIVDFGKANLINKVRQQPDKVRMVLDKIKTDGLLTTLDTVRSKLDDPIALGYCNVGTVIAVGNQVTEFLPGDRVVSNGSHAEIVAVNKNLCAKIPDNVSDEDAVFTVLGAIALQGIRLIDARIGETYVVMGLGLIGLLAVQILKAQGCQVFALDLAADKVAAAETLGATGFCISADNDCVSLIKNIIPEGVDGVLLTLSTQSSGPVSQAAQLCRKRGKIVLVGVTGLHLARSDFYEKELSFQVSCSYGPGRYDPNYEVLGQDYPIGFVRWTEQRNFNAILQLMADGRINIRNNISHRFSINDAQEAYSLLGQPGVSAILLEYPKSDAIPNNFIHYPAHQTATPTTGSIGISFIGSGNYARRHLIPAFAKTGARLLRVSCRNGISGAKAAMDFKIGTACSDNKSIFDDAQCDLVVISTQHNSHGSLVQQALNAGKHVFVEKPLCLTQSELDAISALMSTPEQTRQISVGFNRRFSRLTQKLKTLADSTGEPVSISYNINAGFIPKDHWIQDLNIGGGRLLGEVCHFIDLCRFIAGSPIESSHIISLKKSGITTDSWQILLGFSNGSTAIVNYFTNGHKSQPKEHLQVNSAGKTLIIDNFRALLCYGFGTTHNIKLWRQDKGQEQCALSVVTHLNKGLAPPIPFAELEEVMQVCLNLWSQVNPTELPEKS
jgi:predicted dehydrogenase/threonine dehydrogenase-like Zn-dependent dehydrogenase